MNIEQLAEYKALAMKAFGTEYCFPITYLIREVERLQKELAAAELRAEQPQQEAAHGRQ
jgi:hypothetical protein